MTFAGDDFKVDDPDAAWLEMEARHAAERAFLLRQIKEKSYDLGAAGLPMQGGATLHAVVANVAKSEGIPLAILLGRGRNKRIAKVRAEAYAIAQRHGFSSVDIGRYFGRDHSTVLQTISTRAARMEREARRAEMAQ